MGAHDALGALPMAMGEDGQEVLGRALPMAMGEDADRLSAALENSAPGRLFESLGAHHFPPMSP
ncbi:hypothetical protein T484DRAFT_1853599 [Baffinella frigidus]|nr:hypothetical protein T484DRAFT_1853599 [Cryptophyta sp. CCMP2293]